MNYPAPHPEEYFLFNTTNPNTPKQSSEKFLSRKEISPHTQIILDIVKKYGRLYKSLPFISQIYLCNSITFNACNENSDIDIFIITNKNKLWLARFRSVLLFRIFSLKRSKKNKKHKFCLSFYATEDGCDFSTIILKPYDIYFIYRLAHLVLLYTAPEKKDFNIYSHNKRFKHYLPGHPENQCINLGGECFIGSSRFKKSIEYIHRGFFGRITENLMRRIRLPLVISKKNHLKTQGWGVIISSKILKFHMDKRKKIQFLFSQEGKKTS